MKSSRGKRGKSRRFQGRRQQREEIDIRISLEKRSRTAICTKFCAFLSKLVIKCFYLKIDMAASFSFFLQYKKEMFHLQTENNEK